MIPNHIHFIFFGFTEFAEIHYLSIKSAREVHKPREIFLHYAQAPVNNVHWDRAKALVTLVHCDPPQEFQGVPLDTYQYKADVLRLQILQQQGGIYLDIDVISLKSFDDLLQHRCVVGIESADASSISNAVIMAEPGHEFITEWLNQTAHNLVDRTWAYHGVCLPKQILDSGKWDVHVEPRSTFMPFDFKDDQILGHDLTYINQLTNSRTLHLWETIWWDRIRHLDPQSVLAHIVRVWQHRLKIAIYTICKNEAHHVADWAASNQEADYRLVCDTGSTDNTVQQLKDHGVTVIPIAVQPWRFDLARGTSLNLLPADIDVCIWQDLDERLLPGWRNEIEQHWRPGVTIANHKYRNNNHPWQWHSKIHARHNCVWTGAVHETLRWNCEENAIWLEHLYLDEHQDLGKDRTSYRELLRVKIAEGDTNWRTYYFLANELLGQESLDVREQSYHACNEGDMVRSYIAKNIGLGYAAENQHDLAQKWLQTACSHSNERETWFAVAEYWHKQHDWAQSYVAVQRCLSIQERRNGFTQDPRAWNHTVYDLAALSAYNLGLHDQAQKYGQQALDLLPGDARLTANLAYYEEAGTVPLPQVLVVETNSDCNRTCSACIRNSHPDREFVKDWFDNRSMSMDMLRMIFDQARDMGYKHDLCLSHFNEPLSDPRLPEILLLARTYPFRNIFFHSNGDLLTPELAEKIDGIVNWIMFSVYADTSARERRQQQIRGMFKLTEVRFTSGELGLTHFGPTPHLDDYVESVRHLPCQEPRDRFMLNHRGEMIFCCDDLGNNFGLGQVSAENTLKDLWYNTRFQRMVKQLKRDNGRQGLTYCETCPRPHELNFKGKNIKVLSR